MKFASYVSKVTGRETIGILEEANLIGLSYGTTRKPIATLYDIIENWPNIQNQWIRAPYTEDYASVELLAPLTGRDILAVGKNYAEHAKEFNSSGFDSSDKVDIPSHPVIFSKRATSIVPTKTVMFPHPLTTASLDYEGELGVILGPRPGFQVSISDAWKYVWGYTIINDMTARERQRDHKQFMIGKSPDTFCPIGPIVVTADELDGTNLDLTTHVNGELRQSANTSTLIFDIPTLVETCSAMMTIQPGDCIATGTPAGVGIGMKPNVFLRTGDVVKVSISGIGSIENAIGGEETIAKIGRVRTSAEQIICPDNLTMVNGKPLFVEQTGNSGSVLAILLHGLGGTTSFYQGLATGLQKSSIHVIRFDIEGHGQSPLSSAISVESICHDIATIIKSSGYEQVLLVGHSFGALIAGTFAAEYPDLVAKLVLIGPVQALPETAKQATRARAQTVRQKGMIAVADAIVSAAMASDRSNVAASYVRASILGQQAEGYAAACDALASASSPDYSKVHIPTLIVSGEEDKVSNYATCEGIKTALKEATILTLPKTGHWHLVENAEIDLQIVRFLVKGTVSNGHGQHI